MGIRDIFRPPRVLGIAKNAADDSVTLTFEVNSGFRKIHRDSKMRVNRILPGTPTEAQVNFDGRYATVAIQDGSPPEAGSTYIVLQVSNS